jgi:hypothetical protein
MIANHTHADSLHTILVSPISYYPYLRSVHDLNMKKGARASAGASGTKILHPGGPVMPNDPGAIDGRKPGFLTGLCRYANMGIVPTG